MIAIFCTYMVDSCRPVYIHYTQIYWRVKHAQNATGNDLYIQDECNVCSKEHMLVAYVC